MCLDTTSMLAVRTKLGFSIPYGLCQYRYICNFLNCTSVVNRQLTMAHRNRTIFVSSARSRKVVCIFCNTLCDFASAARHENKCFQVKRFKALKIPEEKEELRRKKLQRLLKLLKTDTEETPCLDGQRSCVKNSGRYVNPYHVVEGKSLELRLTVLSVFRQHFRQRCLYVPEVEGFVLSFLPGAYIID